MKSSAVATITMSDVSSADRDTRYVPTSGQLNFCAVAHESRYAWVLNEFDLVGLRVLDLGCGSGYGAHRLSRVAAAVDAVDYSATSIEYARAQFRQQNLNFYTADACSPSLFDFLPEKSYDVIVSFDVIEHLERYFDYLDNVTRLLRPGGRFLVGCPNRVQSPHWNRHWNPYHFQEFSDYQLRKILSLYFGTVELVTQDFHDPATREKARAQNYDCNGTRATAKRVLKAVLPLRVVTALKSARRSIGGGFTISDIGFRREPGEDALRAAFGLVAICGQPR